MASGLTDTPALIAGALVLLADHADLLTHAGQQAAQRRQLAEVRALVADQEPRGAVAAAVFGRLRDCAARLERAAGDTPGLVRVKDRLRAWRNDLELAEARALTQAIYRGPGGRRVAHVGKQSKAWNAPPPA